MTKGKLLWKNLFSSLARKNINTSKDAFPKAKNLYSCSSGVSEPVQSNLPAQQAMSCFKWCYNLINIISRYEPTAIQGLRSGPVRGRYQYLSRKGIQNGINRSLRQCPHRQQPHLCWWDQLAKEGKHWPEESIIGAYGRASTLEGKALVVSKRDEIGVQQRGGEIDRRTEGYPQQERTNLIIL